MICDMWLLSRTNLPFLMRSSSSGNSGSRTARLSEEVGFVIGADLRRESLTLLDRIDCISSSCGVEYFRAGANFRREAW